MASFHNEEINKLISACLTGSANPEDTDRLASWIEESAPNRKYYLEIKNLWDLSNRELQPAELSIEKAYSALDKNIRLQMRRMAFVNFFQKAAAILLLPLLALSIWVIVNRSNLSGNRNLVFCEVSSAYGTRSLVTLSDGSKIWLNSGSKIRYPQIFAGNQREVFLNGEAYFEVDADPKKPFIVHTGHLNVSATGTRFNINASGLNSIISVTLVSGQVSVDKTINENKPVRLAVMAPDQHFTYDTLSGDVNLIKEETYRHIAWKDGKLIFRNEPLEDVLKKIGYYYNVEMIITDEKLKEYRYRATFEEETIEEIMNLLRLSSPLNYRIDDRKSLPDGTFPRKRIIIFPIKK